MSERTRSQSAQLQLLPGLTSGTVRILEGPDRGLQRTITTTPLLVGSAEGSGLRLRDPKVSRRHCELSVGARGFLVRDLESRNGTYFEGSRLREIAVPPGALLRVGNTHLVLTAAGRRVPAEPSAAHQFGELVGSSLLMRQAFAALERAAATETTVLLTGETGTGKELAARALHARSPRASGPLVLFDCAGTPLSLLHAALFGHERGAFTGALREGAGAFERAHGGTLFVDGIDELPIEAQALLLRACESRTVSRLGGGEPIAVDFRLIAATRTDLAEEVAAGRFREDLYYRLQVLSIELPPLRARKEDLPLLCTRLLERHHSTSGSPSAVGPVDGPGLAALMGHGWPGNVRELDNVLRRALATHDLRAPFRALSFQLGRTVGGEPAVDPNSFHDGKKAAVERFERTFLGELLRRENGNIKAVSRVSGIERTQLKRLLRKHGLL